MWHLIQDHSGLLVKNVKDVTFSIWKQWLYKSVFQQDQLDLGIAELSTGRSDPSSHGAETTLYYVIDGRGRFIFSPDAAAHQPANLDGESQPFAIGTFIKVAPCQTYRVECAGPSMFLVLRTLHRFPQMEAHAVRPGQSLSDRMLAHPQAACEYRYVASGELQLLSDGPPIKLSAGTAIQIEPGIRYSLANTAPRWAQLVVASAGSIQQSAADSP